MTDSAGEVVAQDTNNYGVFPAGSDNGPYGIEVLNQVDKTDLHPGGNVTINTPNPAAPWAANVKVELIFSDTSKLLVVRTVEHPRRRTRWPCSGRSSR